MAEGAAWMIGMRWTIRAIGLLNTIILARLLTPEDFGIVAMATVIIGLLNAMTDFNVDTAILRDGKAGTAHYNSAWTLQVTAGATKSLLLICIAPYIAQYYGDYRIQTVIYIIAARPIIAGFENIGQVDFRRQLQFGKEFSYWVYRRILSFFLTIVIVLWLQDYLALAIAQPITGAVTVILSYVMSSYRPRFTTRHISEIWNFSKWWMLFSVTHFFGTRGEEVVLGGLTTPHTVGAYAVGGDVSGLLTREIVLPVGRAMVPNFAKLSERPSELLEAFRLSFGFLIATSMAAGVGASLVAEDIVILLLGEKWRIAIPFFQWLALHSASWCIVQSMQPYFLVTHREKLFSLCNLVYVITLIPAIILVANTADVEAVAITRTLTSTVFAFGMLGLLLYLRVFSFKELFSLIWRPTLATLAMCFCVSVFDITAARIIALAFQVGIGAITFLATISALWVLSGRPRGIETVVSAALFRSMR